MKKILLALLAVVTMVTLVQAQGSSPKRMMKMFQMVSLDKATILQKGKAKLFCPECGMSLPMFYKTNHAATVDGEVKQYCSLHCLVDDIKKGTKLSDIKVVDVISLKFIPVEKATYVVGSRKKGTMSMVSKYAFADKDYAKAFAKVNGGEVVNYTLAYKKAESDFAKESKMIAKKQAMMSAKGEMMYAKMCQKTEAKFTTTAEAKAFMLEHKLCKALNPKQMQAIGLYLKNR